MKILVFAEQRDVKFKSYIFEGLSVARRIGANAENVAALVIGGGIQKLCEQLKGWGANKTFVADDSKLTLYNPLHYANAFESAIKEFKPDLVLGIASPMGRDLFARMAARMNAPLITDLVECNDDGSGGVKPMYAGKVLAKVKFTSSGLRFALLRPNVFPSKESDGTAQAIPLNCSFSDSPLKILEVKKGQSEKRDLTEAVRIVSGGRSLGSAKNFEILQQCAEVLGATVGASRAAVDSGYASHDMQVGQTGKTVNPSLYIACGISGSIQHMAGMRTSKVIVAINNDTEAPIFSIATYGIVADLFEVVPLMTQKFKELLD